MTLWGVDLLLTCQCLTEYSMSDVSGTGFSQQEMYSSRSHLTFLENDVSSQLTLSVQEPSFLVGIVYYFKMSSFSPLCIGLVLPSFLLHAYLLGCLFLNVYTFAPYTVHLKIPFSHTSRFWSYQNFLFWMYTPVYLGHP